MNKKSHFQIGTIFIIASGFIYTIERFISMYSWIGVGQAIGKYPPNSLDSVGLFANIFVPLFLVIGAISFISGYRKND